MNHSGGRNRGDYSESYYHFVWDDEDPESIDHVLPPSKARERVAKILRETELPDEELTVFTIPKTSKRISEFKTSGNADFASNNLRHNRGPIADQKPSSLQDNQGKFVGNFDSRENLDSMHDFTENGYVEISGGKNKKWRTDWSDSWSFDGFDDRGQDDDDGDRVVQHRNGKKSSDQEKRQDRQLESVRFRKFQSDIGQQDDSYIDDDEFEPEPEGASGCLDQEPRFNAEGKPIVRAILPMDIEMEMESEEDDAILDIERGQEFEFRSDSSDTQPIVMRVDQAELSQEFKNRRRKIKIAILVGITCVICGSIGAIIYLVVHFLQ